MNANVSNDQQGVLQRYCYNHHKSGAKFYDGSYFPSALTFFLKTSQLEVPTQIGYLQMILLTTLPIQVFKLAFQELYLTKKIFKLILSRPSMLSTVTVESHINFRAQCVIMRQTR